MHAPTDWHKFWKSYRADSGNPLVQVGATVGGQPISEAQVQLVVKELREKLQLNPNDLVIDLCCGNGYFTELLAPYCRNILGIDFAARLVEAARNRCRAENCAFLEADVVSGQWAAAATALGANKALLASSLQYMNSADLRRVLDCLQKTLAPRGQLLICGIPDRDRLWTFYNSWRRRWHYLVNVRLRKRESGIGRFWRYSEIEALCREIGAVPQRMNQHPDLYSAHYRFDVRIRFV